MVLKKRFSYAEPLLKCRNIYLLLQMREMGLEPTRPTEHKILSLACLPIPALPHNRSYTNIHYDKMQVLFKKLFAGLSGFMKNTDMARDIYASIYASFYASGNQWDQKPLAALMFFDARFQEMIERFMKPGKGIGWSSTFMKEGIALMLMLLDNGSGNCPGMIAMREIAVHACSFDCEGYCAGTDVVSNSSDSALFQECFDKWKSQITLPENAHELWAAKIEQWIALRVSAIMNANHRNYYGECAAFIAALGEVQESERPGYKDRLMQQYRADYSRRRAFHDELRRYGMRK